MRLSGEAWERGCMGVWGAVVLVLVLVGPAWGQRGKPSAAVPGGQGAVAVRDGSVERFLREFERASEANDANQKAALYGEVVDRYFLRTHVTREFVYRDVLDWLSRGRLITRFRLTVVREEGRGEERTLTVRKEAEWMAGGERKEMAVRSQLVLRRVGEGWRIVGERDFRPE